LKTAQRRRPWIVVACAALHLAGATAARADSYDAAIARGVAARDRALDSGSAEDWEVALDLFTQAIELRPTKEAKFEFAGVAARVHLEDEAYAAYEEALELGLAGKAQEWARAFLREHRLDVARLDLVGPIGTTVAVGGRPRGVLPLARPLVVAAGAVLVHLETPRAKRWEARISLPAGETSTLRPDLDDAPSTAASLAGAAPDGRPTADALAGYISLASAGLLVVTGVVAWRVREGNIGVYNDDSRCLYPGQTRAQQCGGYIDGANVAIGVEIAAFTAAGLSAAVGTWWLLKPAPRAPQAVRIECAPSPGLGIQCAGTF
jgi:hypothetical protein